MGVVANLCIILLCAAAVAAWTQAYLLRGRPFRRLQTLLGAFGIFAFAFSVASPDDDLVQQVFTSPSAASIKTIRSGREAWRGFVHHVAVDAIPAQALPLRQSGGAGIVVPAKDLPRVLASANSLSIHSPPLTR